jgi:DNA repair protein RadD
MTGPLFSPPGALRPLRPHQERAIAELRRSLMSDCWRPMLMLPTGGGKTRIAAEIIKGARAKGKRVAFVVPALSLIDQTVSAFEAEGIHALGVLQGIHPRTDRDAPVQICSVQTLARRRRPEVDLVIVDEAHLMHKEIFRWMADCPNIIFIGLSATPWSRGLGKYYDHLVIAATTRELIDQGYLSDFVAFAPSDPDLSSVSTVAGDFKQDELGDAMDKPLLTGDIVSTWLKRGENRPAIAFCVNRKHAQHIAECFDEAGVAVEYLDGETPREDREGIFGRFKSGATKILCNVGVLTTGFDADVRCVIDAKPTKSRVLFVQSIGRGLRTAPGKDRLIILDHAGNHLRLGMVTDIGQDHLDDGKERQNSNSRRERSEPLPRLCEGCKAVVPRAARECPSCGSPIHARTEVEAVDGELVELGARRSGKASIEEKAEFFAELRGHATIKGYKEGWAANQYREKFGVWPNDPRVRCVQPARPTLKTLNWIKSRAIAFAKRRAA